MQLNKLEIKGFKSFADKIVINFDAGITGIVGPNGCGKSNVVDAIRWVLGEQKTRALRSEKMENIIFNGTKSRKPLQMAEVSLTFNNTKNLLPTEYSQVTISRKYYRSGESEYLLNNVPCRLKDITNLFLDTGIGSDSYAIIELKMVDDILNDKDNSRRGLFEEAAGISKFKIRKKETLRKLEDTDSDLERVEDLLHEISKNLKVLEKQARQTEMYFKLKEEYKHWSVALAQKTVSKHSETFISLGKHVEKEQDHKLQLQAQLNEKEALLEKEKADLIQKEKLLASRQKSLNDHVNRIRQYESDKKIKNERLRLLTDKIRTLQDQIETDYGQQEQATQTMSRLQREKESGQKLLDELAVQVAELKEAHADQKELTQDLQKELNTINSSFRSRQDEVFSIRKTLEIKQVQVSSLKQELERTASDNASHTTSLDAFSEKLAEVSEQLEDHTNQLADLQEQSQSTKDLLEEVEAELESIRQELDQAHRSLDKKQNEYNLTKSLVDNLEGFPEAIQFLKKHGKWDKQTPLVSDILTCPDEYRVALENYLEPVMNYYVVQTEAQAYEAIALLSNANKGKAHFFVLDKLAHFEAASSMHPAEGEGLLRALDIAEFDSRYHNLVAHLLDGVYILTQNPESVTASNGTVYLSQNGRFISRRFSLTGGSVGLFEGKRIGRAKNLENLQKEINQLTSQREQISLRQQDKRNVREELLTRKSSLSLEISHLHKEINQLGREQVTLKTKQEQMTLMLNNQSLRREDLMNQLETLQEEIADAKPLVEEKTFELKGMEGKINRLNRDLVSQNELLTVKSNAYNTENIRLHQQQNQVASLDQEISFHQQTVLQTKLRLEKNTEELQRTEAEVNQLTETAEVTDDELVAMYSEKEAIETGLNEAEKEYYASRGSIDKLEKEAKEINRQREMTDGLLMELQTKLSETKLQLSSVKERLAVEFNVNLDELLEQPPVATPETGETNEATEAKENKTAKLLAGAAAVSGNLPEATIREKVQELKSRLDKIGPINPMALEAYEEIKQRYDFINAQKNDLLNAKLSLLNTISEIDTVARETFMAAYEQIRQNFIKVFRSLFSEEDTCDLKLVDPENPLESPIDILAKPKGKRPLTINQLSGGEKTLTAISLLFAIYLLKPAPFCIFDEVDAPLDDANIDKFNNIIRKFSSESQFIIVTHNKRTMTSTDVIYGITQTEGDIGVSKVVPVDLRALSA